MKRLANEGVLKHVLLIGSWCMLAYEDYFSDVAYRPAIRTRDVDLLVNPTSRVEPATWTADISRDIGIDAVGIFGIRIYDLGAGEGAWIDEVRIGTTFAAVVPRLRGSVFSFQ